MSLFGDNYINYGYPGLNTWRTASGEEGRGIKHNTSGAKLPAWERGIIMHEPDFFMQNDSEEEEEEEEEDDDDDDDNGPQISRAASTFGNSQPSRTYVGSGSKEEKHVEFKKVGRKWSYLDYRGERKPYKDGEFKECFAEDGSRRFVKDGKKHVLCYPTFPLVSGHSASSPSDQDRDDWVS
ncbi:hypothetical protein NOR_08397 [Metarhizium rileyi]|uniref:Uncharacterized protein n=1 Tax=Metarhizium rileyi (strain RCEF 4871) TaxID=1649241 RepID=A0A166WED9_METRR|nr:hypothetical protein NOR_08397 [Metarhizium rileyi RCEF 4871]